MNNQRRQYLKNIRISIAEIMADIEAVRDEEQNSYDSLTEGWKDSERGQAMLDAIENMELAFETLEEAQGYLEEAEQ